MSDLNCPYCNAGLDINHDDGFGYDQDLIHEMECSECEKSFVFTTHISFNYYPEKADCLNGEPHDYHLTQTEPKCVSEMFCQFCGDRRKLTESERIELNIESVEDYIERINK